MFHATADKRRLGKVSMISIIMLEIFQSMGFPPVTATVAPEVKLEAGSASMT